MSYATFNKSTKSAVSVSVTRVKIADANTNRYVLILANEGSAKVYFGDATVTAVNGIPIPSGSIYPDYDSKDDTYAIVSSGTADLRVMEIVTV